MGGGAALPSLISADLGLPQILSQAQEHRGQLPEGVKAGVKGALPLLPEMLIGGNWAELVASFPFLLNLVRQRG